MYVQKTISHGEKRCDLDLEGQRSKTQCNWIIDLKVRIEHASHTILLSYYAKHFI